MAEKQYKITVKTGNVNKAGTNSEVEIVLRGKYGEFGRRLDNRGHNDFEQGAEDNFTFSALDVGPIFECALTLRRDNEHDNKGPAWFPEWVTVSERRGDGEYYPLARFEFNLWLGKVGHDIDSVSRSVCD